MEHIIYVLSLLILASQIPTAHLQYPIMRDFDPKFKNHAKGLIEDQLIRDQKSSLKESLNDNLKKKYDFPCNPLWLKEHPDKEEIIENFKAYSSLCMNIDLKTKRKDKECEVLFENLGERVRSIQHKLISYFYWIDEAANDLDKCYASNRTEHECNLEKSDWERILKEIKRRRLPWSEMHEICISSNTERFCNGYIQFLYQLINPTMELKDVARVLRMFTCINAGEPGEKCAAGANINFVYDDDEEQVVDNDKRDSKNEL